MEDLEAEQIEELKQKAIERVDIEVVDEGDFNNPAPAPPKKSKKVRSEAQKAAFEKAKLKRAENIKLRQKQKEENKAIKKETKIKLKQILQEELEQPKEEVKPQPKLVRQESRPIDPASLSNLQYPHHQPAPVNNYYYYGAPPQHHYESEGGWLPQKQPKKKRGKKARPPTPSSSEEEQSDVDEPETYKDLHSNKEPEPEYEYQEPKIPKFKFNYV